jgi:hypothetical protein
MSSAEGIRRRPSRLRCNLSVALLFLAGGTVTGAAASGQFCASDDTLLFGNRAVGSRTTASATVTNCGDAPWSFTDVSVDPATGPEFQVSTTCTTGLTLRPGAGCAVNVLFAPTATGQTSGGLWLHNTTATPDQLITFYGRGINGQNGTASLAFVPASADFGSQPVGTTAPPLTIALHNLGPAALTLSALVLNGPDVYDFFDFLGTCETGATIAAGDSCSLTLDFRPPTLGMRLANLVIDSPQLASLAIMQISGIGQAYTVPNFTGLFWSSPAGSEAGWGISLAHQGDIIFATWFTYDLAGKGWWLTMTAPQVAAGFYTGVLYATTGPAFDAVPFNPAQVAQTQVGTGTLSFSDANNATFAYTVNGATQVKNITRQVFGPLPVCVTATTNLAAATNYQDLWWASPAGSEAGWGIHFMHQGDTIFATWFTYDRDHTPLWLSVTAPKTAPGVYSGTLYRSTGPAFNAVPFDPAKVALTAVGTATFTFADGNDASLAYDVYGVQEVKSITRQVFQPPGTVCQ